MTRRPTIGVLTLILAACGGGGGEGGGGGPVGPPPVALTLSTPSLTLAEGDTATVALTTGASVSWTASSLPQVTVTPASGTGPATLRVIGMTAGTGTLAVAAGSASASLAVTVTALSPARVTAVDSVVEPGTEVRIAVDGVEAARRRLVVRIGGAAVMTRLTPTGLAIDLPDAVVNGCGETGVPVALTIEGGSAPFTTTVRARTTARVIRLATGAWSRLDARCPVLVPVGGSVHLTLARPDSLEDVTTAVPDAIDVGIGAGTATSGTPLSAALVASASRVPSLLTGRVLETRPRAALAPATAPQCPIVLPGSAVRVGVNASAARDTVYSLTRVDFSRRRDESWRVVAGDSTIAFVADAGVEARLARDTAAAARLATLLGRWTGRVRPFLTSAYGELAVRPGVPGQQETVYLSEQFTLSAIASVGTLGRLDCAGVEWGIRLRPSAAFGGGDWRTDGSLENVLVHETHHILDFAGLAPGAQRPTTVRLSEGFAVMGEHLYAATRLGLGDPVLSNLQTTVLLYDGALYRAWWDAPGLGSFPSQMVGNYPLNGRLVLWAFAQARRQGVSLATAVDRFRQMPERLTLQQVVNSVTGTSAPAGDAFLRWAMGISTDDVVAGLATELADPTWDGSVTRRESGSGWWRPTVTVGPESHAGTVRLLAGDWSTIRLSAVGARVIRLSGATGRTVVGLVRIE